MNATPVHSIFVLAAMGVLSACSPREDSKLGAPAATLAARHAEVVSDGIAWDYVKSEADVDAAFGRARSAHKPVFMYWGATWCPPCNQVKSTLFTRREFIERTRSFVPVYVDGDLPGAQKIGARYRVNGYPTMVLFGTEGQEITRLPGEVDPAQYTEVLTLSLDAKRSAAEVLNAARTGQPLGVNDWTLLAFYSWDTDEQKVAPQNERGAVLRELAAKCPVEYRHASSRLLLKAAAAAADDHASLDGAQRTRVRQLLSDPKMSRAMVDVLINEADDIAVGASDGAGPDRTSLVVALNAALLGLQDDATLSRADRASALYARVALAKAQASVAAALQADVRRVSWQFDQEIVDGYERQAVITTLAAALAEAGLLDASDALLNANLAKSHSPYYLMSQLSRNAKQRGDATAALRWSREAFERSVGPATRLQWGSNYVVALIELSPSDDAGIGAAAAGLLNEASQTPGAFYERNARYLERMGRAVVQWNATGAHEATARRIRRQLDGICAKLPDADAQRNACKAVWPQESQPRA